MEKEEIKNLIKQSENQQVEFKSNIKSFGSDLCAFANTDGGTIIFGVDDNGQLEGVEKDNEEDISSIAEQCEPPIRPKVEHFKIDDADLLVATVKKSVDLHSLSGKVYKRVGSTNRKLSASEMLKEGHKLNKINFGKQVNEKASLEDINQERVEWFLKKAVSKRGLDIDPDLPLEEALQKLKLIKDGQLTNAAVLMFNDSPTRFYLQAETRCGRFKGNKVSNKFIDMKEFQGPVYEQVDEAEQFVMQHIEKSAKIIPGQIEREEKWQYPLEAVREAITNAVAHRNYFSNGHVQVRIFDDRLQVWNSGSLPEEITIEDLKGEHRSRPQNPSIARLFFYLGYIEEWGSGTNKMIELCKEAELPEPEFEEKAGDFVVTFRKSKLTEEYLEKLDLNERQEKAIEYVKKNETISNSDYQELNDVSRQTATRDLTDLLEKELLKQKGEGRNVYYVLLEKRKE